MDINQLSQSLLSVNQVARLLEISADSVRRYEAEGIIHPTRILGRRVYTSNEVAAITAHRKRIASRRKPKSK